MKLEQQVISLELAKRLKALGVKQESAFHWREPNTPVRSENAGAYLIWPDHGLEQPEWFDYYAAFTVAELGEMLPHVIKVGNGLYYLQCNANGNSLKYMDYTTYDENGNGTFLRAYPLVEGKTEAEARGLMLAYLIENKLMGV